MDRDPDALHRDAGRAFARRRVIDAHGTQPATARRRVRGHSLIFGRPRCPAEDVVTISPNGEGRITDLGAGGVQRKMWDTLRSIAGNILDCAIRTIAHGGGQEYHSGP